MCGVLYAVDSATARETKIRFALDLYTSKLVEVEIPFSNPFNGTTSIGFNHLNKELYSWNQGEMGFVNLRSQFELFLAQAINWRTRWELFRWTPTRRPSNRSKNLSQLGRQGFRSLVIISNSRRWRKPSATSPKLNNFDVRCHEYFWLSFLPLIVKFVTKNLFLYLS